MNSALPFSRKRGRRPRGRSGGSERRLRPPPAARPERPDDSEPEIPANLTTLVLRAAFMDGAVYDVIRKHPGAMISSITVVLMVGALIAVGLRSEEPALLRDTHPLFWVILRMNAVVVGWLLWSAVALLFGRWVFRSHVGRSSVFKALGIATAPAALLAVSERSEQLIGQTLGEAALLMGLLWTLVIGTQAIKETMKLSWVQAAIPGILGWVVAWLLTINFVIVLASPAAPELPPPTDTVTSTAEVIEN